MAYAKRLTPEQYAEMKTRYQMGEGIRELSREFHYDAGNLTRRFQKDKIIQGQLQHIVTKKTIAAVESFKTITTDIQQITTPDQITSVQRVLDNKAAQWLGTVEEITDIAMKLNKNLLIEVSNRSKPNVLNGYKPHESAAILRTLGMTHDKLLEQTGISAKPKDANNNSSHSELSNADNAIDASRAYQELLNGSK